MYCKVISLRGMNEFFGGMGGMSNKSLREISLWAKKRQRRTSRRTLG